MKLTIWQGSVFDELPKLPAESVDLVLTSPPYWGLRDYGVEGQLGNEPTMEDYINNMMQWVKEVWRVLKPTGSFVLNLGDCFIGGGRGLRAGSMNLTPRDYLELIGGMLFFVWLILVIPPGWSDRLEKWLDQKLGLARWFPPE